MVAAVKIIFHVLAFAFVHSTRAVLFVVAIPNYFRKPQRCPKIDDNMLLLSARELAAMIRKREVTSEAVVTTYISRIQAVNPVLNAVVENRFDFAIKEAKLVDDMLATTNLTVVELEQKYPLLGLPLTVKESIAVEGCSNASGLYLTEPRRAQTDAPVVRMCKEAGAIPIALTNTPELCLNFESYNNVTGATSNPYDTRRTSAGSSGGEGALLGAAASIIGLASDLFGSIRIPGHFCGVWGHKPSPDAVPIDGHFPNCESNPSWKNYFTMGPMTRYACDLSLLMQVIQKKPLPSLNSNKVNIEDVKVYYMLEGGPFLSHSVDGEIVKAAKTLITHLSKKSCCKQIEIGEFKNSSDYALPILIRLVNDFETPLDDSKYIKELLQYLTFRSKCTLLTVICMFIKHLIPQSFDDLATNCLKKLERMKQSICQILGEDGVLIFPTHPTPATFHNQSYGKLDDYTYTGIFNVLGLPVTQCPLGLTTKGLPIGIQVVGVPDNDGLTIAVAEEIEKILGGWVPPPSI